MFVASRRLFPLTEKGDPAKLVADQSDAWAPLATKAESLFCPPGTHPLGAGLFRKFRLRCSYSDGDPVLNQPQLQLKFDSDPSNPFPDPGLQPSTLTLPRSATVIALCWSSTTEWFTLGEGSQRDLIGNLDRGATLNARLKWIDGASQVVAKLYEVVLECWDFTSYDAGNTVAIVHESSLTWTRPIFAHGTDADFPLSLSGTSSTTALTKQYNLASTIDTSRFPLPAGFERRFYMRAVLATSGSQCTVKIQLFKLGEVRPTTTWAFAGFNSDGVAHRTILSDTYYIPRSSDDEFELRVAWSSSGTSPITSKLYSLNLEAHDERTSAVESPRSIKSMSWPVKEGLSPIAISPASGPSILGRFRELFNHGAPTLDVDSVRTFTLKASWFYEKGTSPWPQKLLLTATNIVNRNDHLRFELPFTANPPPSGSTGLDQYQYFAVSDALTFGDGRALSIPDKSWEITASLSPSNAGGTCYLADVVLEAQDRPLSDVHLPSTQVFSAQLHAQTLRMPLCSALNLGQQPFTIAIWVCMDSIYCHAMEDGSDIIYTFCSHSDTWKMSVTLDGDFHATVTNDSGVKKTAAFAGTTSLLDGSWHFLALLWDGTNMKLAIDGLIQTSSFVTGGNLKVQNVPVEIGSANFGGSVRAWTVWGSALNQIQLRQAMNGVLGAKANLIVNMEFGADVLVNAPGATELKSYTLPSVVQVLIEGQGLIVTDNGCACMSADRILHMDATSQFTLETWVMVFALPDTNNTSIIVGKFDTLTSGYGLTLNSAGKVVAMRGHQSTTSKTVLSAFEWYHVAMTFKIQAVSSGTGKTGLISLLINGSHDSDHEFTYDSTVNVDSISTLFTAGGMCDMSGTIPVCSNSLRGQVDEVRLWDVALIERTIRQSMYYIPPADSPALLSMWSFEEGGKGPNDNMVLHGNSRLGYYRRTISRSSLPTLTSLPRCRESEDAGPSALGPYHPKKRLELDAGALIYIDFAFDVTAIILDVCLDVGLADAQECRYIIQTMWEYEVIRSALTTFRLIPDEVLNAMPDAIDIHAEDHKFLGRIREPEEILTGTDILEQCAELFMNVKKIDKAWPLLKAVPTLSYRGIFSFLLKLVPVVGTIYLYGKLAVAASRFTNAVRRLKRRIQENERRNSKPGLQVQLDNRTASGTTIPICVGGDAQQFDISLNPPSKNGSVTVSIVSNDTSVLTVQPSSLTFRENSTDSQSIAVTCLRKRANLQQPYLSIRAAASKGVTIWMDEREQEVQMNPGETTLDSSVANDEVIVKVSMSAILNSGNDLEVDLTDDTISTEDPAPNKKLIFKDSSGTVIEKLSFSRQSSWSHLSDVKEVRFVLADRTATDTAPSLTASGSEVPNARIKRAKAAPRARLARIATARVRVVVKSVTEITMLAAGKGESYIIENSTAAGAGKKLMLIDGGDTGTWNASLKSAIGSKVIHVLSCTHIDQDHIQGLLEMLKDTTYTPNIPKALFNEPENSDSDEDHTSGPIPLPVDVTQLAVTDTQHDKVQDDEPNTGAFITSHPLGSKKQGRALWKGLRDRGGTTRVNPTGNGPATSISTRNDVVLFPGLTVSLFGPTPANVTTMRERRPGEASNRASTIMVMRGKYDSFTALFAADAWDRLDGNRTDIRGSTTPRTSDHFTVMKVPHHGSEHSEDVTFYESYTADYYLISARWSTYGTPTIAMLRAMLRGCSAKGKRPTFVTTCPLSSTSASRGNFDSEVVMRLTPELTKAQAKIYLFKDNTKSVKMTWEKAQLRDGWTSGLDVRP